MHLIAEFEQVVHQEATNAPKKKVEEKPKAAKLKKLEEEKSPTKKEDAREERGKCKFYLSDTGCRRGKAASGRTTKKTKKGDAGLAVVQNTWLRLAQDQKGLATPLLQG